ncbi:MAG TPA: hypothetical protein VFZ66_27605 [Herpetosiphonaceae bacterium]
MATPRSTHLQPVVPHVLVIGERRHAYTLGAIERLAVRYATAETVRVAGRTANIRQAHCWCLPDDQAWTEVQSCHAAFQTALTALADGLRDLGRYAVTLQAAGGHKQHPDLLCPTVIHCPDPDAPAGNWLITHDQHALPRCTRHTVARHTAKMIEVTSGTTYDLGLRDQGHYTVCPTDDAWDRIARLHAEVEAAAAAWKKLRDRLGTYDAAQADRRYAALPGAQQLGLFAR